MNSLTIAAAQTCPHKGEFVANVRDHGRLIRQAAERQVDVIVFPELSLTGYERELANQLAITIDDHCLAPLKTLAKELTITIVAGAPILRPEGKPYIGALIIGPDTLTTYRKQHLHGDEVLFFSPGQSGCTFEVNTTRIGVAICADTSHAEHAAIAAENGASLYAAGVFFTDGCYQKDIEQLQQYAVQHKMAVLLANFGGLTHGQIPAGKSAIWNESGECLVTAAAGGEALIVATREQGRWVGG